MSLKWIGAGLIVLGCGGWGFAMAAAARQEEQDLRQLVRGLELMEWELQFHHTQLPDLCEKAGALLRGRVGAVFRELGVQLEGQAGLEPNLCMGAALGKGKGLSDRLVELMMEFSATLGSFDLSGQLNSIASAKSSALSLLGSICENREQRLRSYQTLGLCAGAALAILFV